LKTEQQDKKKAEARVDKKRAATENKIAADEKKRRESVDIEEERDQPGIDVIQSLRAQVDELSIRQNEVHAELDSINNNVEVARAKLSDAIGSASDGMYDYSCDSNTNSLMGDRICLQYYYNGRSGVLYLVGDNQILVEADFVKGFLPLIKTPLGNTSDTMPAPTILKTQPISKMQYFVPACISCQSRIESKIR
jgi:hypothetical protein